MSTHASSAFTAAETAFGFLTCQPAPLAFDARPVPGLPDRTLPLGELRTLLMAEPRGSDTTDALWRRLAQHAREWGSTWVVGAVGVALPALTGMAAKISRARPRLADDVDSAMLTAFWEALMSAPLEPPRLWLRLCWAAWRAGAAVVKPDDADELPLDIATGARTPSLPYGHPDLLLGRAAAAGVITTDAAELIGSTRFGDTLIEELAAAHGVSGPAMRMRRRRAERLVAAAIREGSLSGPVRTSTSRVTAPAATLRRLLDA